MSSIPPLSTVAVSIEGFAATVTLNRPEVKNAMSFQMVRDLQTAFDALRENDTVRAIVLTGASGTFCAGGDVNELRAALQNQDGDGENETEHAANFDQLLRSVNQAPQVIITRIEGAAMGGGFGLVCVSDIAIASTTAKFGLPEVRLGLIPSFIAPFVIQRLGLTRARELMLTGRRFDGEQAQLYGLVHEVATVETLDGRLQAVLDDIRQCSPKALAACKSLIFEVLDKDLDATVDYRANLLNSLRGSEEGQEGMMAFVQKRAARWAATQD